MKEKRVDFGKAEERLPRLAEALSGFPEIAAAYLFGSFARGAPRNLSDVDVAVFASGGPPGRRKRFRRPAYLAAAMRALGTDRVDLVVLNESPLPLRHRVFRDGRLLFARDRPALARFREASLRRYLDTIRLREEYRESFLRRIREAGFAR